MSARYQILDRLATTAGSSLYRAQCVQDGTAALVKLLEPDPTNPAQAVRFRREYERLQALDLPGVVKPLALLDERGRLMMVMGPVAGEPLESALAHGRLDLATGLRLARSLTEPLSGLHAAHLIHQDLRPANWLVNIEEGQAWLADVGLATSDTPQTATASPPLVGDWAYLSPEQTGRMNRPVDARTDLYSLGVTFYRLLTGQLPFQASDPLEWMHCHVARVPPPPRDLAPELPQAVSDLVLKLLAKRPEDRYQSAPGLQADLGRCLAQWQDCGRIEPFPLGAEDVPDRFEIPHQLYGREAEVAMLLAAFDRLAETGQAALVTVSGYSGVGKSSLVDALQKPILEKHGTFIAGKFDQYRRDIPYATLAQAFSELVRQILSESDARIADWRQRIQAAMGVNGQLIVDVLPQIELITGKQAPVPALPPAESQSRFRRAFQRFVAVFARPEHPLVLFLDDLQWSDAASLQLVEHLLTDADTRYLLLVAAYRDNEVDASHPLQSCLDTIRRSGLPATAIALAPLGAELLNQLVADTLHANFATCAPLTRLVFERTEGNPFFFIQFLHSLQDEGLLRRDAQHRVWQWELDRIEARDFADNVVDLMVAKLRRLPAPAQGALQQAACLGNRFDLRRLAQVSELPETETEQHVAAAAREGLVAGIDGSYKFLHDRIQQAAYSLNPEGERVAMHLRIGRLLLARLTADELSGSLFDVANQLNRGAALISDRDERARLAELDLRAGRKAKASTAYITACTYLAAGLALLDESDWERRYALMYSLSLECAECEFLASNAGAAERHLAVLLQHAASALDQAAVYRLKVLLHFMKSEYRQAVDSALAGLQLLGIHLPAHPDGEQVRREYDKVWRSLEGRSIESLIDLPLMTDRDRLAAMQLLSVHVTPAFETDRNLCYLGICEIVNLSLEHGMTGASAYGYALFGMIFGPVFHRYVEGYRFSKLACDLVEKHGFVADKARVYVVAGHTAPWTQPISIAIDFMRAAFCAAIETGDLLRSCFSRVHLLLDLLLRGDPLDAVWRESEQGLEFARKARARDAADIVVSQQRLIATMQGRTASFSTFSDADFDETAFEAQLTGDRLALVVCTYWILKLQARFLSGDYAEALAAAEKAKARFSGLAGHTPLLHYFTYAALTIAAVYEQGSPDQQRAWRDVLAAHQEQLREWAENYPPTFGDKHALVSAEIARVEGRDLDAMRLYEQAIRSARDNGFVHNEGVACELASAFYRTRGFQTTADAYLREARSCYARWGADGKVQQLDARYPQLQAQALRPSATPLGGIAQLDLLSVAKASQAISGRIVLDELVDTLLRLVIENAGAQTGALLLARGDGMTIAAEASAEPQAVQVRLHRDAPPPASILPASILNYVRRSRERVLLADAAQPHPFAADPYFADHRPRSVLCLPILRQSALMGLLYLENNLVPHAFTSERLAVLELLSAQAAISLENALLVADLQQENRERRRAEESSRESEQKYRSLWETTTDAVLLIDRDSRIRFANPSVLSVFGYRPEELTGRELADLQPESLRGAHVRGLQRHLETGEKKLDWRLTETVAVHRDGHEFPVELSLSRIDAAGGPWFAGFIRDLTERRQAEADREARQVAEMANRAKSQFLANMSHELRTPLNGILGYAQLLQRDKTLGERQAQGLSVIQHSGEHLLTLINDILDFAKIEAGKLELHPGPIPLAKFLRGLADIVGVKAAQKDLDFACELAPDLPAAIQADEGRLRQVLLNLLSNAVKFTDRGQVRLRVRGVPPGRLRFEVQDTGVGIPEAQRETIFQPFEQVGDAQRRLGGTGLGLPISRELVQRMGGVLQLQSCVGHGSTFGFELAVPVVAAASAASARWVSGYRGPRRTVLVVDDVAANRALLVDWLAPLGFATAEAANGREGLEQAQALRPDLILMDHAMPALDGLEATRRLRRLPAFRALPIIAVSASTSDLDARQSLAAGVDVFLPKPVDFDELAAAIGRLLQLDWTYGFGVDRGPAAVPAMPAGPLVAPPTPELEVLHHLARMGNMRDIRRQAARLAALDGRYRPLAERLDRLAQGYQSQAILNLVEQVMEGDSSGRG